MITYTIRSVFIFFLVFHLSQKVGAQSLDSLSNKKIVSMDSAEKKVHSKIDSSLSATQSQITGQISGLKPDSNTIKKLFIPVVRGRVGLEGYHSTFQNPRMLNEPQYLRLSGNTSVSMGGLPFLVDFYKTSE